MKYFNLYIVLLCILLHSCFNKSAQLNVGFENPDLELVNGILYFNENPFSGNIVSYFDESNLSSKIQYVDGRKHGYEKHWFADGTLSEERHYLKGYKSGIHKAWWDKNILRFEYHFNNFGAYNGSVKEWYKSGQLFKAFNYKDGLEVGRQRLWKIDGNVKANYDVVNGERFGLIGLKKCYKVTVGDDEVK